MFSTVLLAAGLASGQAPAGGPPPGPLPIPVVAAPGLAGVPAPMPAVDLPGTARIVARQAPPAKPPEEKPQEPLNLTVQVPETPKPADAPAEAAAAPDRWAFMTAVQGTWLGVFLDDHRTSFSGWTEMSYTGSSTATTNQPVVWNDRADKFLVNQHWMRLERSVVTSGTTDVTWGYRVDTIVGSDYRFSLPRGLLNSQLLNDDQTTQNLYGVDPIQFYGNIYVPTLFKGTDFRAGRLFTP